ncbi:glycopeptide antibiotics resistance protein [Paenibacillus sp. 4624]
MIIKFFGNIQLVENRIEGILRQKEYFGISNFSIIPFKSISASINTFINDPSFGIVTQFFVGNILIFVPLGFLLALLFNRNSFFKIMLTSLFIIIIIEFTQFVTNLGIADIDDVILNMFGSFLGYLCFLTVEKLFSIKEKIDNN